MAFPQSFMDELLARNDIADVVGSYVPLTPKGGSLWGCCPFHNEKTPSFHVLQDRQMYHCFGCKKGGGVISFIMEIENLTFPEAVQFLARRVNMPIPEESHDAESRLRRRILALNRDAARFYYATLQTPAAADVAAYLNQRRISRATAVNFGLGASLPQWSALIDAMTAKGYTKSELLSAGLAVQGKNGSLYDKFRDRLIFPVIDTKGDVVAFGGRIIRKGDEGAKYMNSPETVVYSKRRVLYGLNLAKKSKRSNIILCEGNIDVVMLHQAGFDNAVASMGTALTPEQVHLLSRFTKELVLCYDNDEAGKAATQKALAILNNTEFNVKVLRLPRRFADGEYIKQDADDFIKYQGRDAFENLLGGSENGMEFRMAEVAARFDLADDKQRIAYATAVSELIASLDNAVEREVYTNRAAQSAQITPQALELEVERALRRRMGEQRRQQRKHDLNPVSELQPRERENRYENIRSAMAEEGVIRLLTLDEGLFPMAQQLREEDFSSPLLWRIFHALRTQKDTMGSINVTLLAGEIEKGEMDHLTDFLQKPETLTKAEQSMRDYIAVIRGEAEKRNGGADPLSAAVDKYKNRKGYGGK